AAVAQHLDERLRPCRPRALRVERHAEGAAGTRADERDQCEGDRGHREDDPVDPAAGGRPHRRRGNARGGGCHERLPSEPAPTASSLGRAVRSADSRAATRSYSERVASLSRYLTESKSSAEAVSAVPCSGNTRLARSAKSCAVVPGRVVTTVRSARPRAIARNMSVTASFQRPALALRSAARRIAAASRASSSPKSSD